MPTPTPEFFEKLIRTLGSEEKALEYLGRWSEAILDPTLPDEDEVLTNV
jgi:hypothetical protein